MKIRPISFSACILLLACFSMYSSLSFLTIRLISDDTLVSENVECRFLMGDRKMACADQKFHISAEAILKYQESGVTPVVDLYYNETIDNWSYKSKNYPKN